VFGVNEAFLTCRCDFVGKKQLRSSCGLKLVADSGVKIGKKDGSWRLSSHDCGRKVEHSQLGSG